MVAVATPPTLVSVSMAFRAKPLTRQASSIVTRSPQLLEICGAPVMPLLKYLTVWSDIGIPAEKVRESGGNPRHQGVSTSPRISNVKLSSGTDSGPCWTVRTTQTGNCAPMVLKRSTLPVAQPLPHPSAGKWKYGTPVAGLLGAQSALVLPVAITPTFSPMTSNEVLLVRRTIQRSVSAPRFVTRIGYCVLLNVAVAELPDKASDHVPFHVAWSKTRFTRANRSPATRALET